MPELLLASEVAALFRVSERSVKEWARNEPERIGAFLTPGGQWRFRADQVHRALRGNQDARSS